MSLAFTSPTVVFTSLPTLRRSNCARQPVQHAHSAVRRSVIMSDAAPVDVEATPVKTVADPNNPDVRSILMLCLGNICRSPAAEAVMNKVLEDRNLGDMFIVDSCGTGGGSPDWYMEDGNSHHVGSEPDVRMRYAAKQRGITVDSDSRPMNKEDLDKFDYIVAMDSSNVKAMTVARKHWGMEESKAQVILMTDFSTDESVRGMPVPDPYYTGQKGFDVALDLIQDACVGLVDHLTKS